MKKLLPLFIVFLTVFSASAKEAPLANDYVFQKQLIVAYGQKKHTCQAVRIHKNWFLTAAHCVEMCKETVCQTRVVLADGKVSAVASFTASDIFVPEGYREVTDKGVKTHTFWDVALLHYQKGVTYEYADGGVASPESFQQALAEDADLKTQWDGALKPKIPLLYVFQEKRVRGMHFNLIVPLWENGEMSFLSKPEQVLYLGQKQSLWASAGFGVDSGNSGGGVYLSKRGLLGVATAKRVNDLPADVRKDYPAFADNSEFFLFNGFSKKTTFAFIESTLLRFGDRVKTKELKEVLEPVVIGEGLN
jgi:hypothetical protein